LAAFASVLPPVSPNPTSLRLMPQIIEVGAEPCDRAGDLDETRQMYPQDWIDWSPCLSAETDGWTTKEGFFSPVEECQMARARWVRRWMRECAYEKLVVVCHHGFLRRLTKTPHHLVRIGSCSHRSRCRALTDSP
jgi:broad specificity phosphatase PhoE